MLAFPSHRRPLALLAAVIAAQVLLLAAQIKGEHQVRLIRLWAVELFTPFQRAGSFLTDRVRTAWSSYVGLRHASQENQHLRAELEQLRLRATELESRAAEADRLAALAGFRLAHAGVPMLAARVISASPAAASRTVIINCGEKDGVRKNMGVITPEGVVGKVLEVYPASAQVLLLTDRESGVGALLKGSRTQGVVKGTGAPEALMDYVINDENVAPGTPVLTSGMDRIFPKDLLVGAVAGVQAGNPFKVIRVKPAVRLDRLEEVLVLLSRQELAPQASDAPAAQEPAPPQRGQASPR